MNKFTESDAWKGTVRGTRKVLKWTAFIIALLILIFIYFQYFHTFSEGYRAGLLQKFSRKGTIFKTYEGEMLIYASGRDIATAPEKFYFSLVNKDLVETFDTLQGDNVIVHYKQKNSPLLFRGDSKYLVDSIRLLR
jgi:hypothetical protein